MEKFTRVQVKDIKDRINSYLKELEDELGVTLRVTNATYEDYEIDFKLIAKLPATEDFDPDREKFNEYISYFAKDNLKPEDYGKEITVNGKVFTICGCNPKATVNNIIIKGKNGAKYGIPSTVVAELLRGK